MNASKIEWTEATWSPVIGCTKVSQGCKNCYAEREVETRWSKNPKSIWFGRNFADVLCRPEALAGPGSPLSWKKPRRIFVCPRADLFHQDVPASFIADVFGIMAATPQHTYQVLTKRPERMLGLLYPAGDDPCFPEAVEECMALYTDAPLTWPIPNVWIGVSVEDQATADERIPLLLHTPAAVRWISAEPLLGPVDLDDVCDVNGPVLSALRAAFRISNVEMIIRPALDWVVVGGESGPSARPMHPDWVRSLRDQCATHCVPILFKQWGEWAPRSSCYHTLTNGLAAAEVDPGATRWPCVRLTAAGTDGRDIENASTGDDVYMQRVGKKLAGRLLNGVLHDAYPEARS